MRIFIAEKPSQGRDIAKILGCHQSEDGYLSNGSDTIVTWCIGHLVSPADPVQYDPAYEKWALEHLPIVPECWKLQDNSKTKKQLNIVLKLLKEATEVVVATDSDREGECIGKLVLARGSYKGIVKRLWLSALDEQSIQKALDNIKDGKETDPLFWAGLGRSRADWLCGMNYTRASTLLFASGRGNIFSVGRVQTPTLRLVVERDAEINKFKAKDFYSLKAQLQTQNKETFNVDWIIPDNLQDDASGRCLKKENALTVQQDCQNQPFTVSHYETKSKSQAAPLVFSLSDLQQKANEKYGYQAKQVLEVAQSLYETHKLTTYPRTDCGYLPLSQFGEASQIMAALVTLDINMQDLVDLCGPDFKSRCWNDKKVNESSHHGIIPTSNTKTSLSNLSEPEKNVYDLVRRQYLAQFAEHYQFKETTLRVDCGVHQFKNKGITPTALGWKAILQEKKSQEVILPTLQQGQVVSCERIELKVSQTTPPKPYTDATLLSAMKNAGRQVEDAEAREMLNEIAGIGTEATRANIIETLLDRQYLTRDKKYLRATHKGNEIIHILPDALSSVEMTAQWEQKLDVIAKGQGDFKTFLKEQATLLQTNIDLLKSKAETYQKTILNPCPKCKSELNRIPAKNGSGFWWGCSNHQNGEGCDYRAQDKNGKPVAFETLPEYKDPCPECGGILVQRKSSKSFKPKGKKRAIRPKFWTCKNYPTCKISYPDKQGKPNFEEPRNKQKKDDVIHIDLDVKLND